MLLRNPPLRKTEPTLHLSTGIAVLNVALSGKVDRGIPVGGYIWFVGDSESGKSFACLTMLAEAANDPRFDKYQLVYFNIERAPLPDVRKFWKDKLANRLRVAYVSTSEEFYYRLDELLKKGPCVAIGDSMDALRAAADDKKYEADMAAFNGQKKSEAGSYGTAKARVNSSHVGRVVERLETTGSILVLVSQVRDRIGTPFPMQTYSGGKALKHYANVQIWTKVSDSLKVREMGKEWTRGSLIQVSTHKNRINGWHGSVYVPFYRSFGLDDVGASVEFLTDVGYWKKVKGEEKYAAKELRFSGTTEQIVDQLRKGGRQKDLKTLVQKVWDKIEAACAIQRDSPYT